MKTKGFIILICVVLSIGVFTNEAQARKVWIRDILNSIDQYWNVEVTIIGEVQTVNANPPGTTRGTYEVRDDSCRGDQCLVVRTRDLPPVGKAFSITGVIVMMDPDAAQIQPILNEISRTAPGLPGWLLIVLIAGGALFLILLIILIVLLVKPKAPKTEPFQPATTPAAPPPTPQPQAPEAQTRKVEAPSPAPEPAQEKTRAFLSLRAEIKIEKGPDAGKDHTLHKQVTTIGRSGARKNDIELSDDTVSKEQASIFYDNTTKEFSIRNESTTNPTQVNKKIVTDPIKLEQDDLIEVGATTLRFHKEE